MIHYLGQCAKNIMSKINRIILWLDHKESKANNTNNNRWIVNPIKWFKVSAKDSVHLQIYDCMRFALCVSVFAYVCLHECFLGAKKFIGREHWKINCKLWLFYCFIWSTTDLLLLSWNKRVPFSLFRSHTIFWLNVSIVCYECVIILLYSRIGFCCHWTHSALRFADKFSQ